MTPSLSSLARGSASVAPGAYYYVAGPVHAYIRFPGRGLGPYVPVGGLAGPIHFLGHCTEAPEPTFVPQYVPVFSSLGGTMVPDDEIFMGGTYELTMELSRFDFTMVRRLSAFPMYGRGQNQGYESALDRGRLVQAQGDSFEVWLVNSFYNSPNSLAYPNMPIGFYFPSCRTKQVSPQKMSRDATKVNVQIKPISVRQARTGDFVTYTQDPAYFKNLPPAG